MAKEEAAAEAQTTPGEQIPRRAVAQRDFRQAARGRRKKRRGLRVVLIVGGLALGASIAAVVTLYAPQLIGRSTPAPTPAAARPEAAALIGSSTAPVAHGPQALTGPAQAVDGATLTVAGQTVRLQGIEAPPASLVCRTPTFEYRCGDVARRVLDSFAGGSPVACLPSGAAAGGTGSPTVALCRNHRGWDLAALQVEAGWAIIRGTADSSPYRAQQARAQTNGSGLWPGFATPKQWAQAGGR